MKFSCERLPLLNALLISSRAAVAKSPIPLLVGLLLEADDEGILITGYDLKTGIITNVEADVEEKGSIVINARLLCDIVRKMPGDTIQFSAGDDFIAYIECEQSHLEVLGSPPADYPELPNIDEEDFVEINEATLKKMIQQTNFAVSDNESRPIHTGALFETGDGELTIVAVDGYRLALRREPMNKEGENVSNSVLSFVVPGAALSEVEKILNDSDDKVIIRVGQKHIIFNIGDVTLISRRLEGEFLNYRNSVPEKATYNIKASKYDLISSLERVSLIINDNQKSPVRCTFEDGVMKFFASSTLGKATDECAIYGADADGMEVGFNDRYFLEALKAAPADEIIMEISSGTTPCVITPGDGKGNFLYMILPVRLRAE